MKCVDTYVAKKSTTTGVLLFFTFSTKSSWLWILKICDSFVVVERLRMASVRLFPAGANLDPIAANIFNFQMYM